MTNPSLWMRKTWIPPQFFRNLENSKGEGVVQLCLYGGFLHHKKNTYVFHSILFYSPSNLSVFIPNYRIIKVQTTACLLKIVVVRYVIILPSYIKLSFNQTLISWSLKILLSKIWVIIWAHQIRPSQIQIYKSLLARLQGCGNINILLLYESTVPVRKNQNRKKDTVKCLLPSFLASKVIVLPSSNFYAKSKPIYQTCLLSMQWFHS